MKGAEPVLSLILFSFFHLLVSIYVIFSYANLEYMSVFQRLNLWSIIRLMRGGGEEFLIHILFVLYKRENRMKMEE